LSALSNMPGQAVLPLAAYDLHDLLRNAERADQRVLRVRFDGVSDKPGVMQAIAQAFEFPAHFGNNLDALYDCLTDLKPLPVADSPGFIVILESVPETANFDREQREALLDVFRDASDFFADHDIAFRMFYSVRRAS
jgi:RNAse (barnase) inhibitor barstar